MKATAESPTDYDASLESDELWEVLRTGREVNVSPAFVQNTVRAARLSAEPSRQGILSWIMRPSLALAGVAGLVAIGGFLWLAPDSETTIVDGVTGEDWLAEGMLTVAVEDPALFSQEELVALIF